MEYKNDESSLCRYKIGQLYQNLENSVCQIQVHWYIIVHRIKSSINSSLQLILVEELSDKLHSIQIFCEQIDEMAFKAQEQRWNRSGFLMSGPDRPVYGSDRSTGNRPVHRLPAGLPVTDRSTGYRPVERQTGRSKNPDRDRTGPAGRRYRFHLWLSCGSYRLQPTLCK